MIKQPAVFRWLMSSLQVAAFQSSGLDRAKKCFKVQKLHGSSARCKLVVPDTVPSRILRILYTLHCTTCLIALTFMHERGWKVPYWRYVSSWQAKHCFLSGVERWVPSHMQYFRVSILRGKPGVRWGVSVLSAFDRQVAFYFMGLVYEANFAWQAHGCLACIFHGTCRTFDVFLEVFQFWGLRLHGVRRIWMYLVTFQLSLAQPSVTFASLCVCVCVVPVALQQKVHFQPSP